MRTLTLTIVLSAACTTPDDLAPDPDEPSTDDSVPADTGSPPSGGPVTEVRIPRRVLTVPTGPSGCRTLEVDVLDAEGDAVADALVTWRSTDEQVATLDDDGRLCGVSPGATEVRASVGDVASEPLYITAASISDDVVWVDDTEVVEPTRVVGGGPGLDTLEFGYVARSDAADTGDLVVAAGETPILGRVVRTREVAGGHEVVFRVVPPHDVLEAPLRRTFPLDLGTAGLGDLGDQADVTYDAKTQTLSVVDTASGSPVTGPTFPCVPTRPDAAADLALSGQLALAIDDLRLTDAYAPMAGVDAGDDAFSITVDGTLEVTADVAATTTTPVDGALTCRVTLATLPLVGTPAANGFLWFALGGVEFPLGAELSIDTSVELGLGPLAEIGFSRQAPLALGVRIDGAGRPSWCCEREANAPTTSWSWHLPALSEGGGGAAADVEVEVNAYADLDLRPGGLLEDLDPFDVGEDAVRPFTVASSRAGAGVAVTWAPLPQQLDDGSQNGTWRARALTSVATGDDWSERGAHALAKVAAWADIPSPAPEFTPAFTLDTELAREPTLVIDGATAGSAEATIDVTITSSGADPADLDWWCRVSSSGSTTWTPATYEDDVVTCTAAATAVAASSQASGLAFETATAALRCADHAFADDPVDACISDCENFWTEEPCWDAESACRSNASAAYNSCYPACGNRGNPAYSTSCGGGWCDDEVLQPCQLACDDDRDDCYSVGTPTYQCDDEHEWCEYECFDYDYQGCIYDCEDCLYGCDSDQSYYDRVCEDELQDCLYDVYDRQYACMDDCVDQCAPF